MRRALTLIETIAATALLALIVASCLPILRSAARDTSPQAQAPGAISDPDFDNAVDDLLAARPALAGELRDQPSGLLLEWTANETRYAASAVVLATRFASADERRSSHMWVLFRGPDAEAVRWMRAQAADVGEGDDR